MIFAKNLYLQKGGYAWADDMTVGAAFQYLSYNLIKYTEYQTKYQNDLKKLNELNELQKTTKLNEQEITNQNELKKKTESLKDDIIAYQTASLYLCMMFYTNKDILMTNLLNWVKNGLYDRH